MGLQFLSDEWLAEAARIRDEMADELSDPMVELKANLIVADAPFSAEPLDLHMEAAGGELTFGAAHLDDVSLSIRTDYETARTLFGSDDPAEFMRCFLEGKILIQGDITPLMAVQSQPPDPAAIRLAERLRAITD